MRLLWGRGHWTKRLMGIPIIANAINSSDEGIRPLMPDKRSMRCMRLRSSLIYASPGTHSCSVPGSRRQFRVRWAISRIRRYSSSNAPSHVLNTRDDAVPRRLYSSSFYPFIYHPCQCRRATNECSECHAIHLMTHSVSGTAFVHNLKVAQPFSILGSAAPEIRRMARRNFVLYAQT